MGVMDTELGVRITAQTQGLEKIDKSAKQAGDSLETAGKKGKKSFSELDAELPPVLKKLKELNEWGGRVSSLGTSLSIGLTAPIVAGVTAVTKASLSFEESFAGIRKTVDATDAEFEVLSKGMRGLAKQIPVNVNELNRIGEAAGQLGIQNKNILAFTRVMADLGVATNLSSEQAADQLARFANITQMSQENFDRLGSTIVDLGNKSAATEAEIVEFGMRLAGAGEVVGLSEAQIMGMATTLASLGLNAEAGGTAFSKVMVKIATAVALGGDELTQFASVAGMSVDEFSRQFERDAIGAISAFVTGLGNIEKSGGSVLVMLEDMGLTETRMRDALLRTAGAGDLFAQNIAIANKAWEENIALTREAEKRYNTTTGQLGILWNKIKDIGITLGDSFLPLLRTLIALADKGLPFLEGLAAKFASLDGKAQAAALTLAGIVAAVGPVLFFVGQITTAVGTFAMAFPSAVLAITGFTATLGIPLLGAIALVVIALAGLGIGIVAVANNWDTLTTATFNYQDMTYSAAGATSELTKKHSLLEAALDENTNAFARHLAKSELDRIEKGKLETATTGLTAATTKLTAEQNKASEAWSNAKGPLDSYFSSLTGWLSKIMEMTPAAVESINEIKRADQERTEQLKLERSVAREAAEQQFILGQDFLAMNENRNVATEGVKKTTDELNTLNNTLPKTTDETKKAKDATKGLSDEIVTLKNEIEKLDKTDAEIIKIDAALKRTTDKSPEFQKLVDEWERLSLLKLDRSTLKSLDDLVKKTREEREQLGLTGKALVDFKIKTAEAELATKGLAGEALEQAKKKLAEYRKELNLLDFKKVLDDRIKNGLIPYFQPALFFLNSIPEKVKEKTNEALTAIEDFASNVASNINNVFAELINTGLKGDFDNLSDIFDSTLDAMRESMSQFIATLISNPIRLSIEAMLKGDENGNGKGYQLGDITRGVGNVLKKIPGVDKVFDKITDSLGKVAKVIPIIGDIAAAALSFLPMITGLFKKTPKFSFEFETVKTEIGERAAAVADFLDADLFANSIFDVITARGGKGAFSGKERKQLVDSIQKAIAATVQSIQDIINKLPADMAVVLNKSLLETTVDIESKIGRSNLLGFDAKGKKEIEKRLEAFMSGGLQARFLFSIRDFFTGAFEQLGTLPEKAASFIQEKFDAFAAAGSEEARAAIGKDLLDSLNAYVDAFNIVEGNLTDTSSAALGQIKALSQQLGFEAVPSLGELRSELKKMIENADIDPSIIQKYVDLRKAIVGLVNDLANSIQSAISSLNSVSDEFGLNVDTGGMSQQLLDELTKFYKDNAASLSIEERQELLDQIAGINSAIASSQVAKAQAQAEASARRAQAGINAQIEQQNRLKSEIEKTGEARMKQLEKELEFIEMLERINQSLRDDAAELALSDASPLTGVEKLNRVNSTIASLEAQLANAATPEAQESIINQIRDAQKEALEIAGDTFGVGSAEQIAIYKQTVDRINQLIALTDTQGRTTEQIQAEIERLTSEQNAQIEAVDATIERLNAQLSSIGSQQIDATNAVSQEVKDSANFVADELKKIIDEQLAMLGEVTSESAATLDTIQDVNEQMLVVQRDQLAALESMASALLEKASGGKKKKSDVGMASGGMIAELVHGVGSSTGKSYSFGEAGLEAVVPIMKLRSMNALIENLRQTISTGSRSSLAAAAGSLTTLRESGETIEVRLVDDTGRLSDAAMAFLERQVREGVIGNVIVKRVQNAHDVRRRA